MVRFIDDQRLRNKANEYRKFPLQDVKYEDFCPEVREKFEAAEKAVESKEVRRVECPRCGFLLCYAYGETGGFLNFMCRKCKFTGIFDMRNFYSPKIWDNQVLNLDTMRWVPRWTIDRIKDQQVIYDGETPIWEIAEKYGTIRYSQKPA
ncbi:MAG: hypothetical protein IKM96_09270 [Clostridiales bacterium]|nr:hypothetical protein [Clostridiales bacterium]